MVIPSRLQATNIPGLYKDKSGVIINKDTAKYDMIKQARETFKENERLKGDVSMLKHAVDEIQCKIDSFCHDLNLLKNFIKK